MSRLRRVLNWRLSSEGFDVRVAQLLCFVAGPLVLVVALSALPRFAATRGEIFIGVLASSAVALLIVLMGLVLPLTRLKANP
jgi:hypothetical protein